jgi:hypothetical protein
VGGETLETSFEIRKDPRVTASQADLDAQFALAVRVREKLTETHQTINAIRALKKQLDLWDARAKEQGGQSRLLAASAGLRRRASGIEEELVQVKAKSRQDTLNYPAKLNAKIAGLLGAIGSADYAPTKGMRDVSEDLARRADAQIKKWQAIVASDIPAFDRMVRSSNVPAVGAGKPATRPRAKAPRARRARAARGPVRRRATAR